MLLGRSMSLSVSQHVVYVESSSLLFMVLECDVFVYDELEGYHVNRTTNFMFCNTSETEDEVVRIKLA